MTDNLKLFYLANMQLSWYVRERHPIMGDLGSFMIMADKRTIKKLIMELKQLLLFCFVTSFIGTSVAVTEVFVVAHSHDDVGWIITPDQYFDSEVQYIYDTTLQALVEDSNRRFIYVEVAYLRLWYLQATPTQRNQIKHCFDIGQIEFIIGGIVMNDEAAAHYESIINQMQLGHQFLIETFGEKAIPRIGWQIDPFGASIGTPTLLAYDCFDALVISRINYIDKAVREETKNMEFIWHGTTNLGAQSDMFTHILDYLSYSSPPSFNFGDQWDIYDSPTNPNPPITPLNIVERANTLAENLKKRANFYATPNFLFPFGNDFNFQNAVVMFKNMDKLIEHINNNSSYGLHLKYATLSDYFNAVNKVDKKWPEYSGDFFPYNDDPFSFWTGYYTSRNKLKITSRSADAWLRSADILTALTQANNNYNTTTSINALEFLRLQSAVAQHHDGISGTARKVVVTDYIDRLEDGVAQVQQEIVPVVQTLATKTTTPTLTLDESSMFNALLANQQVSTVLYNSLARLRKQYVHIKIPKNTLVNVLTFNGQSVPAQIDYDINSSSNIAHLHFQAEIPPLGYQTYYLVPTSTSTTTTRASPTVVSQSNFNITNGFYSLTFINGSLSTLFSAGVGANLNFNQTLMQYNVSTNTVQPGGAYIFRNDGEAVPVSHYATGYVAYRTSGPLVQSVYQIWSLTVNVTSTVYTNATTSIRLFKSDDILVSGFLDVEHEVGPLDGNKDFIVRYSVPNLQTQKKLYQDDSGFLTLERTYTEEKSLITPGNYYPMVSTSYIQDSANVTINRKAARLTVISANSHGCTTRKDGGVLEVMLHRRTLQDDYRGLDEPLNDFDRIKIRHRVILDTIVSSENYRHQNRLLLNNPIVQFFGNATSGYNSWSNTFNTNFTGLSVELPVAAHLITLQIPKPGAGSSVTIRLQNLFQGDSVSTFNGPVSVDLNTLFPPTLQVSNVKRLTLTGNQELSKCSRMNWSGTQVKTVVQHDTPKQTAVADTVVTLQPSEIATFSFDLKHV